LRQCFYRFDPSRESLKAKPNVEKELLAPEREQPAFGGSSAHLTSLALGERGGSFINLVLSEVKLMLKGVSRWWYLVAIGLFLASLATPLNVSQKLLVAIWIPAGLLRRTHLHTRHV